MNDSSRIILVRIKGAPTHLNSAYYALDALVSKSMNIWEITIN